MKEPKAMREIHKIREEMSKMSKKEKEKLTALVREKYKDLIIN